MKEQSRWNDYFQLPNPGLRGYFLNVERGNDEEYRTPFFKGKSLSQILSEWDKTLISIQKEWPTLYEFENDLRKKVGPMSIMKPLKDRLVDIDSYYDSISLESEPISHEALANVKSEWGQVRGLELRSQQRTVDVMKKSTNSGSPYFSKRKAVVHKTVPCTVVNDSQILRGKEWKSCAVLGWRGQEGGPNRDDVKQRVVWMMPFAVNINELQFYQPAIEAAQRLQLVPAWIGMEQVDMEITKLFDSKSSSDLVVCTDFTKFDQHFNPTLQSAAKEIIASILSRSPSSISWLDNVFPIKYIIPLAYDYGKIRTGPHGMASGSGGTNFDETLVHRALQHEAAIRNGKILNPHSQCLGDDGVLTYPGIQVDDVVQAYSSHGLLMNTDKQYASKHDCTYLRRWHHEAYRQDGVCVGVYSTFRALGRLCEQERYYDPEIWGPKMVALRQLSILENVKYHPLKEEFLDYCIKGDKYRLGLDIPGFFDNITTIAREAIDQMPDFLGYTKTLPQESGTKQDASYGIADWWVVKALLNRK